jgi:predicted methyltransferase
MHDATRYRTLLACALLFVGACATPAPDDRAMASAAATAGADPAINKAFPDADVAVWTGRLEGESREIYRKREDIVDASGARPGMTVADVGAGTGLFTMLFARRVAPGGSVVAVDISQPFLDGISKRAAQEGLVNVTTRSGTQTETRLSESSVDLVFTSDTYHHFEQVTPVLASIRRALKPRGRFIVIDFERIPGVTPQRTLDHVRAGKDEVIREVEASGFRFVQEVTSVGLKQNYYLVFEKR